MQIRFPINSVSYFHYETDVIELDVPLLFGLDSNQRYQVSVDEVHQYAKHEDFEWKVPLVHKLGHLFREWPSTDVLHTRTELEQLHRRFAHPSAKKLHNLLRKIDPSNVDTTTKRALDEIRNSCESCQRLAPKPCVFQVSLPEDIQFNHEVIVDVY